MKFFPLAGSVNPPDIFSQWRNPFCFVFLVLFFLLTSPGTGQALVQNVGPRNYYTLNSLLSLTYERKWGVSDNSFERFAYGLNMNFNGFVIDPRLIGLTVNGSFAQEFNSPADRTANSTVEGFSVRVNLLQERPRTGLLHVVPQPIELRYEYFSFERGTRQNYGISMTYRFEPKKPSYVKDFTDSNKDQNNWNDSRNTGNNNQDAGNNNQDAGNNNQDAGNNNQKIRRKQRFFLSRPTFYFDYDRYEYKTDNTDRTHDRLSLRAFAKSLHAEYFAEYRLDNYDTSSSKTQFLQLQSNLHYYWKESLTSLDSYNIFLIEDTPGAKNISLYDRTSWIRHSGTAGRDSLFLGGGVHYFSSDSKATYGLDLNAGYNRFFSERFLNFSSAGLSYQKNSDVTNHAETVKNNARYRLSESILLINDITVGQSQDGAAYGLTLGLQLGRVFVLSPSYSYQYSESLHGGKTTTNTLYLDLSAPLLRRMNFFSRNYYRVLDEKGGLSPHKDKTLSLMSSLLWSVSRYYISVNASYLEGSTEEMSVGGVGFPKDTTRGTTTISANLSTYLSRRMNLNVGAYYQREKGGFYRTIVTPQLTWQWRRVTLTARYTLNKSDRTEHRVFFRVTRQFQSNLRPFL